MERRLKEEGRRAVAGRLKGRERLCYVKKRREVAAYSVRRRKRECATVMCQKRGSMRGKRKDDAICRETACAPEVIKKRRRTSGKEVQEGGTDRPLTSERKETGV